jgi:hypothetical protein
MSWRRFIPSPAHSRKQIQELSRRYGPALVVTHVSLTTASLCGWYMAIRAGVDVAAIADSLGFGGTSASGASASGASDDGAVSAGLSVNVARVGEFAAAYAAHKLSMPVRLPVTVAATPWVARVLPQRIPPPKEIRDIMEEAQEEKGKSGEGEAGQGVGKTAAAGGDAPRKEQ